MSLPFARTALASALLGASVSTFAQDALVLDDTVVSAAGYEQKITEAPASVTVVSQEDLQKKPYAGLADALRDIEGIDVGATQDKAGNISITMRGLEAKYTLVLIDGRRQSDIGDIAPNNFGNNQFMYMPSVDSIERIEVVRGPMSTLYGADAMGGVINIITKKVKNDWGGSISHNRTFQENSQFGDNNKTEIFASGPVIEGLLGLGVRGSYFHRDESTPGYVVEGLQNTDGSAFVDEGGFGDRKSTEANNWNAGFTLNLTPSENHDFQLEYDAARQKYDNSEGQSGTLDGLTSKSLLARQGPRVGYKDELGFERHQLVLAHTGRWSIGTTETTLTYSTSENTGRTLPLSSDERRRFLAIKNDASLTTAQRNALYADEFLPRPDRILENENLIFDTKLNTQLSNHFLTVGAQFLRSDMEDGVFGLEGNTYKKGKTQRHEQVAIFAEDNWELFDPFTLTLGVRLDDHNIYGSQLSPRVYGVYRLNDQWTFKGGVSTGYKTPTPNELIEGVTGFGSQGLNPMIGSPDLQPEKSLNYELATYFEGNSFSANATLFLNKFRDKIESSDSIPNCFAADGTQVLTNNCAYLPSWAGVYTGSFGQKTNIDKAETYGAELAANWRITEQVSLKGNYTYTDSEIKSGINKGDQLTNVPRHMVNATLGWQPRRDLGFSLIGEYRDERYRGTGTATAPTSKYYEGYTLFHAGATFQASESLTLNARVNNLMDEDLSTRSCLSVADPEASWYCSSDYNVAEAGRSYWLSANYRF